MKDTQTYMWPQEGNETPKLGRKVSTRHDSEVWYEDMILMMPLYETVAEWVCYTDLKPYPSEPIPNP